MKKILCPVNFSETALNAIEYASSISSLHKGNLTLFHVITNEEYNAILEERPGNFPDLLKDGQQEIEDRLSSLCSEISKSYPDLQCGFRIGYGSLSRAVIELAGQEGFDLIVMGNEGVKDVTEALDGSSTVKVIEKAPCPVLCIPKQAEFQGLQKIVYGTQFNLADRKALHDLMLMVQPVGSFIDVVHILTSDDRDEKEKALRKMEELKSYLSFTNINFQLSENKSSVRLGLNDFMEEVKGDLLVLVSHQRGFFKRVFEESNFKNLSYFADYPMLIFLEENLLKK